MDFWLAEQPQPVGMVDALEAKGGEEFVQFPEHCQACSGAITSAVIQHR